MSHFLAMEDAIIAHLGVKLADLNPKPKLYNSADLMHIKDRSQGDLSVFVAFNGDVAVEDVAPNVRHIGRVTQQFMVWVVARSARDHATQHGTRQLADDVLSAVVMALIGAKLLPHYEQLTIADAPSPAYADGFGYFPLAFNTRKTVRGATT